MVMCPYESRRSALERRFGGLDGFHVVPYGKGPSPDLLVVAIDRDSVWLAHRASALETVHAPKLLMVEKPFAELAGVMWFGAHGIVLDTASDHELSDVARLVAQHCTVVAEDILADSSLGEGKLAFEWTVDRDTRSALDALSEREREVLTLVGTGRNNAAIAAKLWVSTNTVRSHVQRLMRKLGLRNRLCLVIFAHELGLVDLEDTVLSRD